MMMMVRLNKKPTRLQTVLTPPDLKKDCRSLLMQTPDRICPNDRIDHLRLSEFGRPRLLSNRFHLSGIQPVQGLLIVSVGELLDRRPDKMFR
jgi:hypothetical protein